MTGMMTMCICVCGSVMQQCRSASMYVVSHAHKPALELCNESVYCVVSLHEANVAVGIACVRRVSGASCVLGATHSDSASLLHKSASTHRRQTSKLAPETAFLYRAAYSSAPASPAYSSAPGPGVLYLKLSVNLGPGSTGRDGYKSANKKRAANGNKWAAR